MTYAEAKELADALEGVERRVGRLVYELRAEPAEAERHRLSTLLGRAANRMFNGHDPVYPSNLLDVISAWLGGYELGGGHADIEKAFRDAVADADRPVPPPRSRPVDDTDVCCCGHVRDEHGGDPAFPASLACSVDDCMCVHFDVDEDAPPKEPR